MADYTVHHGDCLEFLRTLPAGSVDAVVTDPPYGLGNKLHRPGKTAGAKWSKLYGDGAPSWDTTINQEAIDECLRVAKHCIVWGGQYYRLPASRGWLAWDKIVRKFSSGHMELAWSNLDQPIRAFNFSHGQLASEGKVHPTQKPVSLMAWCLSFLPENCTVLDPFCGSGTTGIACVQTGRKFIGCEIDEKYVEIARRRIAEAVPLEVVT